MGPEITPLLLTYNEAPNIERTLRQLTWAKRIVVLDSFSTDDTLAIASRFQQVDIVQRRFDSFAEQCNYGLTQIVTPWVLSLDADYVLTDECNREIAALKPTDDINGFSAAFTYYIYGRPLRASLYPPRVVLYRRESAHYVNDGHGHRVRVSGNLAKLRGFICHDDRKPLERWLNEQKKYARFETAKLLDSQTSAMNLPDRLRRKIILAPFFVFFYTLVWKRLLLEGWPGWFYVFQRVTAEMILSIHLIEAKWAVNPPPRSASTGKGFRDEVSN